MRWAKPSDALMATFEKAVPEDPRVERRKMFGFPAAFVGGKMFMGLHEERLVFRFGDDDGAEFERTWKGEPFQPMPGRSMAGWFVAPPALLAKPAELRAWAARALAHATSLGAAGKGDKGARGGKKGGAPRGARPSSLRSGRGSRSG